jgi:DNA-binding beta-propeller fold protein YncE
MVDLVERKIRYLKPEGLAAMQLPINVAVDQDGTRYVTDTKRMQVLIYDEKSNLLGYMGRKGEMKPCGIALSEDRLFVTDLSNHCVRVYNKLNRELLFKVPRDPQNEEATLRSPTNIALDQQGRMYVSDTGAFVVKVYDAEGQFLFKTGSLGLGPGQFNLPKGIAVDKEGRFYVVDGATGVVQIFDEQGRLLMFFGYPGSSGPGSTYLPAGLAIDYDNVDLFQEYVAPGFEIEYLILLTNQAGKNRVSVYGFLKK